MKKIYSIVIVSSLSFIYLLSQNTFVVMGDSMFNSNLNKVNFSIKLKNKTKSKIHLINNPAKLNVYAFDYGEDIAVDNYGYVYVLGTTYSRDFPVINGYQDEHGGIERNSDVFIAKIDTTAVGEASLVYSTYLGGDENDAGYGIAVDNNGYVYITGKTSSSNFPVKNHFQKSKNSPDAFIAIIDTNLSGTDSLIYSTYLGGSETDYGYSIDIDEIGYLYVTGYTASTDFPVLNGYQMNLRGVTCDVFMTKIDLRGWDSNGSFGIVYSTYLGGSNDDYGYSIAVDNVGNAYLTGETYSSNFPILNEYQGNQEERDAFITRINTNLVGNSSLVYSSYLGGLKQDCGRGVAVDDKGYAYVTGYTGSYDYPVRNEFQRAISNSDAFITKIDTSKSGDLSILYSTYLGGYYYDDSYKIAVDDSENVYITGYTESLDFPFKYGFQNNNKGGRDIFIAKVDTKMNGSQGLVYSSYIGGNHFSYGRGVAIDDNGYVYLTGYTRSSDFPTLNEYQEYQADYDAFVLKLNPDINGQSSLLYSTYLGGKK